VTVDAGLLANAYLHWIRSSVSTEVLENDITELTVPFMDRHNDHLQIYAERLANDAFLLSDDGYILSELRTSGVRLQGQKREELVHELLGAHGVALAGKELQVEATSATLGQRAHSLIQAMLSLDDMFVLAQPQIQAIFFEDVASFLDDRDIRYSPRVKIAGRSGLDHLIDFVIPKSKSAPERVLQVVNSPRRDRIESLLFAAQDTRAARSGDVNYYAILNDARRSVSPDIIHALGTYQIRGEAWSNRDQLVPDLVA
jgi:hypothetical protein